MLRFRKDKQKTSITHRHRNAAGLFCGGVSVPRKYIVQFMFTLQTNKRTYKANLYFLIWMPTDLHFTGTTIFFGKQDIFD
jgi:hypothetical protein